MEIGVGTKYISLYNTISRLVIIHTKSYNWVFGFHVVVNLSQFGRSTISDRGANF